MSEQGFDLWIAYHLHYHEDLNRAVTRFVRPAISSLLRSGWIDSFFFVRCQLGGPHVRLRLRVLRDCQIYVADAVQQAAAKFLATTPSTRALAESSIAGCNRAILAADPYENDEAVYPDNFLRAAPFCPEVERYGGLELLAPSLDFFSLSSVEALRFLREHGEESRSRQLFFALGLLLRQALWFACDGQELLALLRNALDSWGESLPAMVVKSNRVFAERQALFLALFREEIEVLSRAASLGGSDGEAALALSEGSRYLSWVLRGAHRHTRWRVGASQLHMTANRMGLLNAEEVYLGGLLAKSASEIMATQEDLWCTLENILKRPAQIPPDQPFLRDFFLQVVAEETLS